MISVVSFRIDHDGMVVGGDAGKVFGRINKWSAILSVWRRDWWSLEGFYRFKRRRIIWKGKLLKAIAMTRVRAYDGLRWLMWNILENFRQHIRCTTLEMLFICTVYNKNNLNFLHESPFDVERGRKKDESDIQEIQDNISHTHERWCGGNKGTG